MTEYKNPKHTGSVLRKQENNKTKMHGKYMYQSDQKKK